MFIYWTDGDKQGYVNSQYIQAVESLGTGSKIYLCDNIGIHTDEAPDYFANKIRKDFGEPKI